MSTTETMNSPRRTRNVTFTYRTSPVKKENNVKREIQVDVLNSRPQGDSIESGETDIRPGHPIEVKKERLGTSAIANRTSDLLKQNIVETQQNENSTKDEGLPIGFATKTLDSLRNYKAINKETETKWLQDSCEIVDILKSWRKLYKTLDFKKRQIKRIEQQPGTNVNHKRRTEDTTNENNVNSSSEKETSVNGNHSGSENTDRNQSEGDHEGDESRIGRGGRVLKRRKIGNTI